ncbi:DUF2797 domain-containing protein [Halomonas sp. S2151]|uniref:DUF2797 domain-containing protein n=1 Tax=Halomonas sp. S2151 TaxID=579478 RepID=UPI0005F9D11D
MLVVTEVLAHGCLSKMGVEPDSPARYTLKAGENRLPLNDYLGRTLRLEWSRAIACTHCGRATKKSFGQGHCYPCFKRLAQCDSCIMKPELCHFFEGTCREPEWGERFCFQPHVVYLSNASGLKVGITRNTQMPTRWLDQGAIQALPILEVDSRQQSGFVEVLFKNEVSDRTNWRAMLKGQVEELDLAAERDRLLERLSAGLGDLRERFGADAIRPLDGSPRRFDYPVLEYPTKVTSHNLDKNPRVEGTLMGIKGQYLIFDTGVINLRKYTGYEMSLAA